MGWGLVEGSGSWRYEFGDCIWFSSPVWLVPLLSASWPSSGRQLSSTIPVGHVSALPQA